MRIRLTVLLAALAAALLGGCAVAPAYGPYGYGYNYPYYYGDGGPYYGYGPGYYSYDYGSPGFFGSFRFDHRGRDPNWDRRWRDSHGSWHRDGSWQHDSLHRGNDRTSPRMSRAGRHAGGTGTASRSTSERHAATPRQSGRSRQNGEDRSDRS